MLAVQEIGLKLLKFFGISSYTLPWTIVHDLAYSLPVNLFYLITLEGFQSIFCRKNKKLILNKIELLSPSKEFFWHCKDSEPVIKNYLGKWKPVQVSVVFLISVVFYVSKVIQTIFARGLGLNFFFIIFSGHSATTRRERKTWRVFFNYESRYK